MYPYHERMGNAGHATANLASIVITLMVMVLVLEAVLTVPAGVNDAGEPVMTDDQKELSEMFWSAYWSLLKFLGGTIVWIGGGFGSAVVAQNGVKHIARLPTDPV